MCLFAAYTLMTPLVGMVDGGGVNQTKIEMLHL